MKVEIIVDDKADDLHISVTCRQLTPEIEKLLENLRMMNHQLTARKHEETYLLDIAEVIYIESIDRKCFVYTAAAEGNGGKEKMSDCIKVEQLSVRFSDVPVLDHLSFEVPEGMIFGLLGPSGAGKTTLIKVQTVLISAYKPDRSSCTA